MNINIREKDDVAILDLEGNIDINASNFVETVGWVLTNKSKQIICNFESVNLIDYVGISLIAVIYKNVLNHNGIIKLCNVPSHVMKLFSIVGLDRVFEYHVTEDHAFKKIKEETHSGSPSEKPFRRRFTRIPLNTVIEYRQKFSDQAEFYSGKIINLSADGVFVAAQKLFSIGDSLTSRVHLLPEPGVIEVDTKVVWITDQEIQPDDFPGMGLEFYDLDAKTQEKIVLFVERHITHSA
ncbi:MAG: PilZ domain-containing protein [Candidatus Omnitrophica bacterium]|nr:PilZ domain-containing protein [Candidatus Omnitrophota bacterium]MBU2044500.1 PilZ domain-containing protein [Candidatus Omnitrophota bacterium]MBU2251494.1 PilZ domain-containing protein [Candidatus Omnitrophota bacterium]MBU2265854.1 PilZ domain-containing protein [Candidatus Omnitrophota bacterium]MBU2473384.1 PilZ domain-containing protein [Candidatus Omnitrophota bacterium]